MEADTPRNWQSILDLAGLTRAVRERLGGGFDFYYEAPHLAGGLVSSPAGFDLFLRCVLSGRYFLGADPVCTLPGSYPNMKTSPAPVP